MPAFAGMTQCVFRISSPLRTSRQQLRDQGHMARTRQRLARARRPHDGLQRRDGILEAVIDGEWAYGFKKSL